jgi:ABC-2 type transport system permease protein
VIEPKAIAGSIEGEAPRGTNGEQFLGQLAGVWRWPATSSRLQGGIAYALVTLVFLWDLVGSLLSIPSWLVKLTPFAHIGLVPAQPFRAADAAVMLALAGLSALAAVTIFARRDLTGQ